MKKVTLRKFKPQDAQAVSRVMLEAFETFLGDKMDASDRLWLSPKTLRKVSCATNWDGKTISFVAKENKKIVGYIRGSVSICGLACLEVVGVSSEAVNKGIGTAMMKALENFFRKNKARKIYTCVAAHNTKAMLYYIKNGFVPEGYQRDHFKKGVDEINLGKFLS